MYDDFSTPYLKLFKIILLNYFYIKIINIKENWQEENKKKNK